MYIFGKGEIFMRDDYRLAKKLGERAVREAVKNGTSPYLPVLDSLEEIKFAVSQKKLGLMELPISRIKGNKEAGRNSAFANNFMPLFAEDSEFAMKWSNLYDSYKTDGIRDAIKVYEYMNQYYVQEGNKRVSVSKYGGTEYILADVTRIIPPKSDSKEVKVYYEYMDFYRCTKIFLIVFSEPGAYKKLAEFLGQDLENKWPDDLCRDLKSAFYRFSQCLKAELKMTDEFKISNSFLMYLSIFPLKTLFDATNEQITKNIRLASGELLTSADIDKAAFLSDAPVETEKQTGFMGFFTKAKKYTAAAPLRVAFIYDVGIEESRWTDSHEAGRLFVDEMTGDEVVTSDYFANKEGGTKKAVEKAIAEKNEIVFATSPEMQSELLKIAVLHPEVKFLNCSLGNTYSSIRCYQGKLYEAAFLMGVLAANTLLLEQTEGPRKIGYIVRTGDSMSYINLNAFAIGVSLIDPECRISLKCMNVDPDLDYRGEWAAEGVKMFADIEYSTASVLSVRPGLYEIRDGKDVYIGAPFYNWGKYYVRIVQSVLSGAWDLTEAIGQRTAANYWFGLSTGVVDVRTPKIPYQTKKMLSFFKNAIISGMYDPFSGDIVTSDGKKIKGSDSKTSESKILSINWLNENIDGTIPSNENA